ncbi:MAG: queuosine precursor transporter [candidate division Zixibacteria bacterium]|nr:queuosine precursor transporter [candidate division Zixibacteria bacterium]
MNQPNTPASTSSQRVYKYYDLIMALFVTVLLCSNLIGPAKIWSIGGYSFGAGILFFPISYVFGDILTEVYGYARARKVVWAGFGALLFASLMSWVVLKLPPAESWNDQKALETAFGSTSRIIVASMTAYSVGEFCNSFVLAKLKLYTKGKFLWLRALSSTVVGAGIDSAIFYPVAFYGVWSNESVVAVMFGNYALKVLWEVLAMPFTYKIVRFLKAKEHEDYFDWKTDFTPFSIKT